MEAAGFLMWPEETQKYFNSDFGPHESVLNHQGLVMYLIEVSASLLVGGLVHFTAITFFKQQLCVWVCVFLQPFGVIAIRHFRLSLNWLRSCVL